MLTWRFHHHSRGFIDLTIDPSHRGALVCHSTNDTRRSLASWWDADGDLDIRRGGIIDELAMGGDLDAQEMMGLVAEMYSVMSRVYPEMERRASGGAPMDPLWARAVTAALSIPGEWVCGYAGVSHSSPEWAGSTTARLSAADMILGSTTYETGRRRRGGVPADLWPTILGWTEAQTLYYATEILALGLIVGVDDARIIRALEPTLSDLGLERDRESCAVALDTLMEA